MQGNCVKPRFQNPNPIQSSQIPYTDLINYLLQMYRPVPNKISLKQEMTQ
jgi:hypothetical protein